MILSVSKLSKSFSGNEIFNNVSFSVNKGERVALIGQNGTGKSTILKIINGDLRSDSGEVNINPNIKVGYLSQQVISNPKNTVIDEMLAAFTEVIEVQNRLEELSIKLSLDPEDEKLLERYGRLEEEYQRIGGYEYLYLIDTILSKFGVSKDEYDRVIDTFSGGEKTRISFAKLLLTKPELLILDEPTNHLDIEVMEWLESYLKKYEGSLLIVTHDKYFIDNVCNKIVEIYMNRATLFSGNYSYYLEEKVKRYETMLKQFNKQQKEIAHLESFVERFRYKANKAKQAQDRVKKLEKVNKIEKPKDGKRKIKMELSTTRRNFEKVMEFEDLAIGYDTCLIDNINLTIYGGDKVAIIGGNGKGKTTLLKTIIGKLDRLDGKIKFINKVTMGYFDQNQESLSYDKNIFEELRDSYPGMSNTEIRNYLGRFLFSGEDVFKPISALSGGEKVRLSLLKIMIDKPNLLILDEPSNHLDIETKEIVEDTLEEYDGTILMVTHDRYLVNKVASRIVEFDNGVNIIEGNYDDYKEYKQNLIEESIKKEKKGKVKTKKIKKVNINKLEIDIMNLEEEIKELNESLFLQEIYTDKKKYSEIENTIKNKKEELDELYVIYEEELMEV